MNYLALILGALLVCMLPREALSVHNDTSKVGCLDCHSRLPFTGHVAFSEDVARACTGCHPAHSHKHPTNVTPSLTIPKDMPLTADGKVSCITCHTYHTGYKDTAGNKAFFLRREKGKSFCYSCHKKL